LGLLVASAAAATRARDLIGVWSSERDFGPDALQGQVVLQQRSTGWVASIGKATAQSAPSTHGGLSFGFSDNQLQLNLSGADPVGQLIQPATVLSGFRFATPVRFTRIDNTTWSGEVHPLADVQHLELILTAASDGTVDAFVRNPEGNQGARIGVRRVEVSANNVRLVRSGSPDIVGSMRGASLTFTIPGYSGTFTFERVARNTDTGPRPAYTLPLRLGDGWATGSLESASLDEAKIEAVLALIRQAPTSTASPYIQSLQIARHGVLVMDEYFNGFSIDRPHDVRSAGKSVTTLLVGRAIQDGARISPATPVAGLFPQYAPLANDSQRKQAVTVADLMTMSSGFACDDNDDASPGNEDTMQSQTAQPDWYKYTLDLPMAYQPGSHAVYCSAGINLLGAIVQQQTKMTLQDYFYTRFAAPMQFGRYALWLQPPPTNAAYMGGGDYFLPRDFLKFGELFLEHGRWNGRPIIDDAWLQASAQPRSGLISPGDYGYGWHLSTYTVTGRSIKAISAGGNGGQLLYIFPQLDMAVMITAANYGQYPVWQRFVTELIPNYIIAAAR
jgi:CubicO group peptidase (beta-lactamase class C family)